MRQCKIYGTARHATDNITQRMRGECWISNTTDIHSEYTTMVTRTLLNATFIPMLPVLLNITSYLWLYTCIITERNR
jgi:hypothetical protein